jgi:TetR/AcrR family transcriptional regulator, ethionamide resistance regulator
MSSSSATSGGRRSEPLDRRHIERRELTARRLLPAVERLLEHETYPELSVDQLVEEADISRSTFYNYFEDKSDLLRALTGDVMTTIIDATRVWWMLSPQASKQDLGAALAHLFEGYSPHAALMRAVAESISHDALVREEFVEYMERGTEGVANYIRAGQDAGVLRRELDADRAAEWLTWGFERGLSQLSRGSGEHEPDRVVAAMTDVLWRALH